ncbi:YegP family protein [Cellulomonas sp. URHB0016]
MDTLELYPGTDGDYRWRDTHTNGHVLADSAEGYRRKRAALKGAGRAFGLVSDPGSDAPIIAGNTYQHPDGRPLMVIETSPG